MNKYLDDPGVKLGTGTAQQLLYRFLGGFRFLV
jgi:hypothetical protein